MGPIVLYDIVYLADRPDCVDACAAWACKCPIVVLKEPGTTLRNVVRRTICLSLFWRSTAIPTCRSGWPDKTPWISAVYTLYRYRGQRIAATLVERIQQEAKRLGFDMVHLQVGSAAEMYRKFGFREIDRRVTDTAAAGHEILFCKDV